MLASRLEQNRILVVDDDELVSAYIEALLESESYQVTVFNQPREALQTFSNNPDNYDLVITDQVMPDLSGVEIAQAVNRLRPGKPVLLITGYSEGVNEDNAASFGLSGYFAKPIDEVEFLKTINSLVTCAAVA